MGPKIKRWVWALGWVGFIYATLGVVRNFTNFFRSLGILNFMVICGYILICGICLLALFRTKNHDWWRYAALLAVLGSYFFFAKSIRTPEEKIHFFEYGLVGILFYRALQLNVPKKWLAILGAFIIGGLAGWVDELIQGHVPGRYYDPRDILLNAISVALGLIVIATFPAKSRSLDPSPKN